MFFTYIQETRRSLTIITMVVALLVVGALLLRSNTATNPITVTPQETPIVSQMIPYSGATAGYLVRPASSGKYPGVILIHEWWGLNEHIKNSADQLAREGYIVLAVDLFNGTVATTPEQARAQVSAIDQAAALQNLTDAIALLKKEKATKLASLGWCFGGGQAMQLALNTSELDAHVIYYGTLVTDSEPLTKINGPVLGIFGDQDTSVTAESVRKFDAALEKAGIENEIYLYPGVGHAFANPSNQNYAPVETQSAWQNTLKFLNTHLRSK